MKKQIFILVLAFLAITFSTAYGQMLHNSSPIPLGCVTSPTSPLAGVPYNYKASVNPGGGDFQWWATKDVDFIKTVGAVTSNNSNLKLTPAADKIVVSGNYGNAVAAADNVDITWSSSVLANTTLPAPTFVVVQYNNLPANCANNLKVYQITPVNGFTVDIKNMTQLKVPVASYGDPVTFCVSDIASAKYVAGSGIVTNYGTNILYFEVVAANFSGGYTPSFQVTGLSAGQTVTSLEYDFTTSFTSPIATTPTAGIYSTASPITVDPSVTSTATGVSIFMKLTIANGSDEHLADSGITLAVNGTNSANQKDVANSTCGLPVDFDDTAAQTITKRPKVSSVAATGIFVTP